MECKNDASAYEPALVEAAREAGTRWLVVEQDESPERPALEDARLSAEHLLPLL